MYGSCPAPRRTDHFTPDRIVAPPPDSQLDSKFGRPPAESFVSRPPSLPMPPTPSTALLCLACSASLPPHKVDSKVYLTQCCARPICPHCLSTNSRLARYNPCLRCLAGVNAVKTRTSVDSSSQCKDDNATTRMNVDGSVRDEDIFVVEDEDESESDTDSPTDEGQRTIAETALSDAGSASSDGRRSSPVAPSGKSVAEAASRREAEEGSAPHADAVAQQTATTSGMPPKYYIRPDDTLIGISLKLKVDVCHTLIS